MLSELYGERYAEFLDNVEAYKYFPLAVSQTHNDLADSFSVTVRFKGISGKIDQAAGIAFNIKPNGDYLVVRANCLEHNLVLFTCEKGKRKSVQWIRDVHSAAAVWHELKVTVEGNRILGFLNGKKYVDNLWREPIEGKIGLWSKADSYMLLDDFRVTAK